jgi:hypothetical protein
MNLSAIPEATEKPTRKERVESRWKSLDNQQRIAVQRLLLRAEELGREARAALTGKEGATK